MPRGPGSSCGRPPRWPSVWSVSAPVATACSCRGAGLASEPSAPEGHPRPGLARASGFGPTVGATRQSLPLRLPLDRDAELSPQQAEARPRRPAPAGPSSPSPWCATGRARTRSTSPARSTAASPRSPPSCRRATRSRSATPSRSSRTSSASSTYRRTACREWRRRNSRRSTPTRSRPAWRRCRVADRQGTSGSGRGTYDRTDDGAGTGASRAGSRSIVRPTRSRDGRGPRGRAVALLPVVGVAA